MAMKAKKANKVKQALEVIPDDRLQELLEGGVQDCGAPDMRFGASEERPHILLRWARGYLSSLAANVLHDQLAEGMHLDDDGSWLHEAAPRFTDTFWQLLFREWPSFDAIPHLEYADLMQRLRRVRPVELMPSEMRSFYEALPDKVAVYRGGDGWDVMGGLSWTLDYEVAETFARGHRGMFNPHPVVISGVVAKDDIAFATNERGEKEVVVFDAKAVRERALMRVMEPVIEKRAA